MNDKQVENLISELIRQRDITLYDMIGGQSIDPHQSVNGFPAGHPQTFRPNRFTADCWSDRLIELLAEGHYDAGAGFQGIKIPVKDLIRFWWNRCISVPDMLDNIFEGIFCHFKDRMLPVEVEKEKIISIETKQLLLPDSLNIRKSSSTNCWR